MESDILTKNQIALLGKIKSNSFLAETFYLTGGTALAAFYLGHRYSEDLDFFSEKEIDTLPLNVFFRKLKSELGIITVDFQQSYNRNLFFCRFKDDEVKTEFTFFPFPRIEDGKKRDGIKVDSILDIAVNKLFTIYQRTAARDYVDLYCIVKQEKFQIGDLIKKAKIKFDWHIDPLQLGTQFVNAKEAKDYPRMVKGVTPKEWQNFFMKEAKKLKKEIF